MAPMGSPLGHRAGKPALVALVANCNRDTNCDNLRLTRPRIVEDSSVKQSKHQDVGSGEVKFCYEQIQSPAPMNYP